MKLEEIQSNHDEEKLLIQIKLESSMQKIAELEEGHTSSLELTKQEHLEEIEKLKNEADIDKQATLANFKEKVKEKMAQMKQMY